MALGLHRYRLILRIHGARSLLLSSLVCRTGQFGVGLALLLVVHERTGSFGIAGTATGLMTAGAALSRVPQGRLADRRGTRVVLFASAALFTLFASALVAAVAAQAGTLVVLPLAFLAGACGPAINSITRVLWVGLVPSADERVSAYALDALVMEVGSMAGPATAGVLATTLAPTLAFALLAGTVSLGTVVVAVSRAASQRKAAPRTDAQPGIARPLVSLAAVTLGIGLVAGGLQVAVPAFAAEHDATGATGPVLGCLALGSAIGGFWYGTRVWRASHERQLLGFAAGIAAGGLLLPLAPALGLLAVFLVVLGFSCSPTLTTIYLLIDHRAPRERLAEATAVVLTALPSGAALGSLLGGWTVSAAGVLASFVLVTVLSLIPFACAAHIVLAAQRRVEVAV